MEKKTILIKIVAAIISLVLCSAIGILSYYIDFALIVHCGIEVFVIMLVTFLTLVLSFVAYSFLSDEMTKSQIFKTGKNPDED